MKNKEASKYKKMSTEALQGFLALRRRGGKVPAKKGKGSYNRRKMKQEEE